MHQLAIASGRTISFQMNFQTVQFSGYKKDYVVANYGLIALPSETNRSQMETPATGFPNCDS